MTEDYELLRELKREGEEIIFSEKKKRMALLSEEWETSKSKTMEAISRTYGIDTRQKFQEFKEKFNITDY
jgi:spore coat polysaccharide biosynthesis predicted glycosyltransferase SpsG